MNRLFIALLVILVVIPFFALGTGSTLFYRLFYALVLLALGSVTWSYVNLYRLQVTSQRPRGRFKVGDTLESVITLRNPTFFPKIMLEVQDLTRLPGHTTGTLVNLKPYSTTRWPSRVVLKKRGVYNLGDLRVTSTDLFGLFNRHKVLPSSEEVVVYPDFQELPWLYVPYKELMEEGRTRHPTFVATPMASSIREYMHGDSQKHIHWPTTARKGRLMSKQFDRGMENRVWVVMDLEQKVHVGGEVENTEEYLIKVSASVVSKFVQKGWAVGLMGQGDRWYFVPGHAHIPLDRYLDVLARCRAQGASPLASVLAGNQRLMSPAPFALVIVTPSLDPEWVYTLTSPQLRGVVASVVLVDPSSFGGTGDPSGTATALKEQGIVTYVVRQGDSLSSSLDWRGVAPEKAGVT